MKIWKIALILFLINGCQGVPKRTEPPKLPAPPPPPYLLSVDFQDRPKEGGLFLSYEEYRRLEKNIIEQRRYIGELEAQIDFYRAVLLP